MCGKLSEKQSKWGRNASSLDITGPTQRNAGETQSTAEQTRGDAQTKELRRLAAAIGNQGALSQFGKTENRTEDLETKKASPMGNYASDEVFFHHYRDIRDAVLKQSDREGFWENQQGTLQKNKKFLENQKEKWKSRDSFFNKQNHVYESVEEGKIGSIYFGEGNGGPGGRMRLLHGLGPKIEMDERVTRYDGEDGYWDNSMFNTNKGKINAQKVASGQPSKNNIYERIERVDSGTGRIMNYSHPSRGRAERVLDKMPHSRGIECEDKHYEELLHMTEVAEIMAMPINIVRYQKEKKWREAERLFDEYEKWREIFGRWLPSIEEKAGKVNEKVAQEQVDRANHFLFSYLQHDELYRKIPLNTKTLKVDVNYDPSINIQSTISKKPPLNLQKEETESIPLPSLNPQKKEKKPPQNPQKEEKKPIPLPPLNPRQRQ